MNYPYEATIPLGVCALATLTRASHTDPWRAVVRAVVPWVKAEPIDPADFLRVTGQELPPAGPGRGPTYPFTSIFGKADLVEQPLDHRMLGRRLGPQIWKFVDNEVFHCLEDGHAAQEWTTTYFDVEGDYGFIRELERHIAEVDPEDTAPHAEDASHWRAHLRSIREGAEASRAEMLLRIEAYEEEKKTNPNAQSPFALWGPGWASTGTFSDPPLP